MEMPKQYFSRSFKNTDVDLGYHVSFCPTQIAPYQNLLLCGPQWLSLLLFEPELR